MSPKTLTPVQNKDFKEVEREFLLICKIRSLDPCRLSTVSKVRDILIVSQN